MAKSIRRVTLQDIGRKAFRDEQFFKKLQRARKPENALSDAGLSLSAKDLRKLRRALAAATVLVRVDPRRMLARVHKSRGKLVDDWGPWPNSWAGLR